MARRRLISAIRLAIVVLVTVWLVLSANAWKYFSAAGAYGAYLSVIHAVDVLQLPPAAEPAYLGEKRSLNDRELSALTKLYSVDVSRGDRPDQYESYVFHRPNVATFNPHAGIGVSSVEMHYIIHRGEMCDISPEILLACYRYYKEPNGELFRYFPRSGPLPAQWRRVRLVERK